MIRFSTSRNERPVISAAARLKDLICPPQINGQDARIHRFDDAPVQQIELSEGALFLGEEGSRLFLLFDDETRKKGDEVK